MSGRLVEGTDRRVRRVLRFLPRGQTLPDDVWTARHRGILIILWAHAIAIPIFALVRGFPVLHALSEGLIVPAAAIVASSGSLSRRVRTLAASMGLLSSSAVLVHMSGGVIEMHFHFFVMVTVVALYQDWLPFLAAIAYVFIHHGVLGAVDPDSVFNHRAAIDHPWRWAGIHALFITGISATCLVTWRLNEMMLGLRKRAEDRLREIAIDNARLYESERDARVASDAARTRLGFLADASRVLTTSLELDTILESFATLVSENIADYCVIDLHEPDGVHRLATGQTPGGHDVALVLGASAIDPADETQPVVRALGTGRPELLDPAPADLFGHDTTWDPHDRPASAIVVPLVGRQGMLGALTLARPARPPLGLDDLLVAEELGRRAGVAVENARLYDRQRSVAETLQHSLLPERLPDIPGVDTAARYRAGGPGVEVGGDWYDLIPLGDGRFLVAMGDVVGRGERAAALMGQLRSAVRVYAVDGLPPARVLERVNDLLHELGPGDMATMVCAIVDPEGSELVLASAGHPPPIVATSDGTAAFVESANGPPVGAVPRATYTETTARFAPDSILVLYTDGLVEDRSTPLDVGLERLRMAVAGEHADMEVLCDHALATAGDLANDDVALLAVRVCALGDRFAVQVPTNPSALQPLRATLRRWLVGIGAGDEEVYEILVAAGEACANAVRHTRWSQAGWFEVEATLADAVRIKVRDNGTWRPARNDGGGRGLQLIDALMDRVDVDKRPDGTTVTMSRRLSCQAIEDVSA